MKTRLAVIAMACFACSRAIAGDYILTIDGQKYEVTIGKPATVKLPNGDNIRLTLNKKAIVSFNSENFSFQHPGKLTPSQKDLGDGVSQTIMVSPLGTLVIVQEYTTIDPSRLVDMMLDELTKEEVKYGYHITKSPATRKLSSGAVLQGKMAVSKYRGHEYTRYVLCYKARDAGIMIVTQIEKGAPRDDRVMLETFWKSLQISMK